jgi:putative FmdB family regulatory protein
MESAIRTEVFLGMGSGRGLKWKKERAMPIYEYQCEKCGHCFERLMFAGDGETDLNCPACGRLEVRKLVSCASTLSGSGGGLCSGGTASRFS